MKEKISLFCIDVRLSPKYDIQFLNLQHTFLIIYIYSLADNSGGHLVSCSEFATLLGLMFAGVLAFQGNGKTSFSWKHHAPLRRCS